MALRSVEPMIASATTRLSTSNHPLFTDASTARGNLVGVIHSRGISTKDATQEISDPESERFHKPVILLSYDIFEAIDK